MNSSVSLKDSFAKARPGAFFLDARDRRGLSAYLKRSGWLARGETILESRPAGAGNMNYTLRVRTNRRGFIVKQGRPWVEKYAAIAAPWGRTMVEAAFYRRVSSDQELAGRMPRLIGCDPASQVLALEDLGEASDFTFVYNGARIGRGDLDLFMDYLKRLHSLEVSRSARPVFSNRAMRRLNFEHIFILPLAQNNGLDLDRFTPGLGRAAQRLKKDRAYVREVAALGKIYLKNGSALLHGDFYPGSWLKTAAGARVIDPEFCFLGPPEFDLGVLAAHLTLSDHPDALIEKLFASYRKSNDLDKNLALRFAGVEIMRRLLGVAQLPLARALDWKERILDRSRRLVGL